MTSATDSSILHMHGGVVSQHGGITVEKFLDNLPAGHVTAGCAIYAPGSQTGDQPVTHPGLEFLLVLEGTLVAEVSGQGYSLAPGDTLRFPSTLPHRGYNPGAVTTRALFINCTGA